MGATSSQMTLLFKPGFARSSQPVHRIIQQIFDVPFVKEALDHSRQVQDDMMELKSVADTLDLDRRLTAIGALNLKLSAAEVQKHCAFGLFRFSCRDLLQERRLTLLRTLHSYIVRTPWVAQVCWLSERHANAGRVPCVTGE